METISDVGPNLKTFYYHVCKPDNDQLIRGCVIVLHGAEGHGGRYGPFGEELAKNGYAMFAVDHLGHGLTTRGVKDDLGKWAKSDFSLSAYNAYYLADIIRKKYPGKPIYLLGDDYGGAMAQYMIGKYENAFDGVILSGCGKPSWRSKRTFLKAWFKKVCLYDGGRSKGTFKSRTRFLNMHFGHARTKYDWMNSVPEEVDRFIEDPLSGYVGTIGYYYYQYKYIVGMPMFAKLRKANKNIPILMLGGAEDYLTGRGRQVEALKRYYERKGFLNVESKIYEKSRHDILLEWNKEQVAEDIAEFINKNSNKQEVVEKEENEEVAVAKDEYKVITLSSIKEEKINEEKVEKANEPEEVIIDLKEEEPEDELKISTNLKNGD